MSILKRAVTSKVARFVTVAGLAGASAVALASSPAQAAVVTYRLSSATGPASVATAVITVTGSGFTTAAGAVLIGVVDFNASTCPAAAAGTAAAAKTIVSATRMVITVPSLAAGAGGAKKDYYLCGYAASGGALMGSAKYTVYTAPAITAANSPVSGPAAGGNSVVITGTSFTTKSVVKFGTVTSSKVTVARDGLSITAVAPAQAAGAVAISVTTEGGTNPTPATPTWDDYTYTNAITVTPQFGLNATASPITITGVGFNSYDFSAGANNDAVMFIPTTYSKAVHGVGGSAAAPLCTSIQVVSDTELVCTTPATVSNTTYAVTVVNDKAFDAAAPVASVISASAAFTFAAF